MIFPLFDLLSLFYTAFSLRTLWRLGRNWRSFVDDTLTLADCRLAKDVAFFLGIPIGVLLHELGHAVATWQVGGQVLTFQYRVFWGFIIPVGRFTPLQDWWIAFAGNLVSFLFGIVFLPFLKLNLGPMPKYLIVSFARYQLFYTLVGYPLLNLVGFAGDWQTIYSPQTWQVGVPLLVIHIGLVIGLWRLERSGWFRRWTLALDREVAKQLATYQEAVAASPVSADRYVDLGNFYFKQRQLDLAMEQYRRALQADPSNGHALLNIASIHMMRRRPDLAEPRYRQALALLPPDSPSRASAHHGLAGCFLERGQPAQALAEYDQALALVPQVPDFYYWRGIAHRNLRHMAEAQQDFARAVELAGQESELGRIARQQLATTEGS